VWRLYSSKSKKSQIDKEKNNKKSHPQKKKRIIFICFVAVGALIIAGGAWVLISDWLEDVAIDAEYEQLLELFFEFYEDEDPEIIIDEHEEEPDEIDEDTEDEVVDEESRNSRALTLDELARLNPDFVGILSIRGVMRHPVVRGSDNTKYLNTTFFGRQNTAGAIFMDYRNKSGFDGPSVVINGHHSRGGRMFAPLARYLDQSFLQRNSTINVTTRDGRELTYTIYAAQQVHMADNAYATAINNAGRAAARLGAPEGTTRILLLSTCVRTQERGSDQRILVFAASFD